MKEEEKIDDYLQRVDDTMSVIRGLGEDVKYEVTVKKVLKSLTSKYDIKVSAIEEAKDFKTFFMDELFASLSAYEMRTIGGESSKREVSFNTTHKGKEQATNEDENDFDAAIANFARKLKKGSRKYKGKLPFKCFNCGRIGHFASKCPYGEKDEIEKKNNRSFGKDKMKKTYKPRRRSFGKKNNLYTFEDDATYEDNVFEEDCSEEERELNFFMAQDKLHDEHIADEEEVEFEAEVDFEGEIVSALEELRKVRKEYKKIKYVAAEEQGNLNKCLEESEKNILGLRTQLDEARRIYEVTKSDLENKEKEYQKMEEEIMNLRKELEKCKDELKVRIKYEGNTDALDKMLSKQKHYKETKGVGFEAGQCSTSKDSLNR